MQFESKMAEIAAELESRGYVIDKPNIVEGHIYTDNLDANASLKRGFIDEHFAKINTSDAILVINEDKNGITNYIGGNTLIEMSHAYAQGLDIFLLNPVPEIGYSDEIHGMHPVIIEGNLDEIDVYVEALPLVYMSTESALKQGAISRAMRRAGTPVRVVGKKVASGVNEQPMTIEETYTGAFNRHKNLKDLSVEADYYVTVESGLHSVHENYGHFGCQALIFEPNNQKLRLGVDLDIEFPKEMLAQVPSKYADIGVLVQEEYGALSKDPYPYLTNGKVTRQSILENAFYNLVIQEKISV
jgi:non-canonical (house-cleaning) NTP pyrophosphatase